jgi:hypothetical protein
MSSVNPLSIIIILLIKWNNILKLIMKFDIITNKILQQYNDKKSVRHNLLKTKELNLIILNMQNVIKFCAGNRQNRIHYRIVAH